MSVKSINPATDQVIKEYKEHTSKEVKEYISKSHLAYESWRKVSYSERALCLVKAAEILRKRKSDYAQLMASEMGKVLKDGESEIEKCAWVCEYYAEQGEEMLSDLHVESDATESLVSYQPLGVVLAVMPWNFPFWQVFRFLAPALMAGNGAVLKHASNVTGCALAIEDVITDAGFPKDLFKTLIINSDQVESIISNEHVQAVTLTGSTPAGKSVASIAGKHIKKSVLELGGSDPYIVLEDADIELAAKTCVTSRLINNGQSCIAAKRFIVVSSIKEEFEKQVVSNMKQYTFGDPFNDVDLGTMARKDLRDELHDQVVKSIEMGATLLMGGELKDGKGAYYAPTVLTDVKWGSPAYHEELFGPVASIIEASSEKEAISIANDSFFGLGAAVFTKNVERGKKIAREEIQSGSCFVNDFVKSDPRLPFGGIKGSGFGRELGPFGIKEFVNIKTVYIK
ncbi:NAD-dependent succinate-semialdehyde dehydrogenase [Fulvivirga lutea]|uniref:NAD-dependent succinate-semialdehyde dehydrogenase n=1 Tax=Fulvivirga lutea TaxID=2810512 RepID=A0A974WEU6_9BACT|nr:NAD-dependent succinate-semialdehyde dehydrogenase [Fulvivirga lutea]QSE96128.1 NAD-dependent succinate-semialdehyde dehydrogenase [Fulvivirga lutea]